MRLDPQLSRIPGAHAPRLDPTPNDVYTGRRSERLPQWHSLGKGPRENRGPLFVLEGCPGTGTSAPGRCGGHVPQPLAIARRTRSATVRAMASMAITSLPAGDGAATRLGDRRDDLHRRTRDSVLSCCCETATATSE